MTLVSVIKMVIIMMIIIFYPQSLFNCHSDDNFFRLTVTTAMVEAELTAHSLLNLHKVTMAITFTFGYVSGERYASKSVLCFGVE